MRHKTSFSRLIKGIGFSIATVVAVSAVVSPYSPLMAGSDTPHVATDLPEININNGFADLVKVVRPAVVNISVTGSASVQPRGSNPGPGNVPPQLEEFFRRFLEEMPNGQNHSQRNNQQPSKPYERKTTAVGSGFIVDPTGLVVTNNHVIEDADEIEVVFDDGTRVPAILKGVDKKTDLALLEISVDKPLPYVIFGDSEEAEVGDWVIAIGNPFGLGGTTTSGIISARGRDIRSGPLDDFIQVDASINRGNSGGPLFNTKGEVIGVNSAIYSPNGGSVGIGFAIPSSMAGTVIAQLKEHGIVKRGFLGVHIQSVSKEIATSLGLEKESGALVTRVVQNSPAETAGIEAGDVILKYNGSNVDKMRDLPKLVAMTKTNTDIEIELWRGGKLKTVEVVILNKGDEQTASTSDTPSSSQSLGLELAKLDEKTRQSYQLDEDTQGVVVVGIDQSSVAAQRGVREGDIIRKVDQVDISTPEDVYNSIGSSSDAGKESVLLLIERDTHARFIVVPLTS